MCAPDVQQALKFLLLLFCTGFAQLTISLPIDATLFKGHDVLCEGSSLVREDVLDLPQLLVQRGGPGLGRRVLLGVVHLQVPVDEIALAKANHFHAK